MRETARPPDGVELRSRDGTTYTGVVVVERSELVLMLAVAHAPGGEPERRPIVDQPRSSERSLYHYGNLDPDNGDWDQHRDPFRR